MISERLFAKDKNKNVDRFKKRAKLKKKVIQCNMFFIKFIYSYEVSQKFYFEIIIHFELQFNLNKIELILVIECRFLCS